jgi:hypothetical protein
MASARCRRANGGPAGPSQAIGYAAPGPPLDPVPAPMDPGAREEERARPGNGASLNATRRTRQPQRDHGRTSR